MSAFFDSVLAHIVQPIIWLGFAVALAYFVWGLIDLIRNADSEEAHARGRWHILYGALGFAIIFGAYGILGVICNTIGAACAF